MTRFNVHLRNVGHLPTHDIIRVRYAVCAQDDVAAAMRAKEKARKRFKDRSTSAWFADSVEKREAA